MGLGGLEPPTSPLSGVRSNQLSYRPESRYFHRTVAQTPSPPTPTNHSCGRTHQGGQVNAICGSRRLPRQLRFRLSQGWSCLRRRKKRSRQDFTFKEVIQPQVPLRLPCYDFVPVMNHTVVTVLPKVRLATSGATHSHDVTGGVYKARERIHRDILIRDY